MEKFFWRNLIRFIERRAYRPPIEDFEQAYRLAYWLHPESQGVIALEVTRLA